MHGVGHPGRVFEGRKREGARAVFGHDLAIDEHAGDVQILQVVQKHDIGALARGDGAQLVVHAEAGGGVDGHHLDGAHHIGLAQDVVEVPVGHERVRVRVVGDEVREARVDVGLGDGGRQVRQVEPRRAVAQLGVLPEAHLRERVLGAGRLVAAAHAAGNVGVQPLVGFGDGVVARDHLVSGKGGGQLAVGVIGARQHAGEVHHLAEAHHAVPGHGVRDLGGAHGSTGVLEAGHGRHAGRRGHHGLQWRARGILHHHLHAFKAEYVTYLVGVPVNAHGAVGHDGTGVLAGPDHGRFHVDVPVQKARGNYLARGANDAGALADAMGGALAHIGDAALRDGHVDAVLHFGRAHVHEPRARDHRVGGLAALGHGGQGLRALPKRFLAEMVQHGRLLQR